MRCSKKIAIAVLELLLISAIPGFAQQENQRFKAATLDGTTGLFKVWDAENLRKGETNWSFGYDQLNRDPGQLSIGRAPAGVAIGIFDRFEFFESMDVQRHIRARNIALFRVLPGQLPRPSTTPLGTQYFSQAAPFQDVLVSTGRSDVHFGLKFNLLSERRGDSLSLGMAAFGTLPGQRTATGLNRGLSSGAFQGGFAMLFSKTAADFIRFHLNLGPNFYSDPEVNDVVLANLQNEFVYRGGAEFPATKPFRFIAELNGIQYFGSSTPGLNPTSPIDLMFGIRIFPQNWFSFGGGYQASLRHVEDNASIGALGAGYNGFVVQGAFGTRRNDPPTVTCAVAKASILQQDTTTIRANASDPDRDVLTYSWTSAGGRVSGTGDTATFDATGIPPGKYTVTATVSDKKHQVSCSSEITVLKRNHAPTVTVEPRSATLTQGESATFRANASDPDNDQLTYNWTVDGQRLAAAGPQIAFGSEGRKAGTYSITANASDGELSAGSSAAVTVRERVIPNQPPAIECLTTTIDVASGETTELRARAADPDGDKLTTNWTSTGGTVSGSGESATFNASGVKAGSYSVTATVDDGRGGKASCTMTVNVSERLSVTRDKCGYFAPQGTRVDNCAKAILDDLAVRMKNEPRLRANIIGYTDDSRTEKSSKGLGEKRAKTVAGYLEKQGVEASRLTITNGGINNPVGDNKKASGRTLNRRVEIELAIK
jgi:outer membrane protein OmpA-like peptidoglycan-associated protein